MCKILGFVAAISLLNLLAFFLVADPGQFMLVPGSLSEPWRLVSFQFVHIGFSHLAENIIGFIFVGLIATELGLSLGDFSKAYFLSIFLVVPLAYLLSSAHPLAGNSTGVYGALAFCLVRARRLIPLRLSFPVFALFIFPASIMSLPGYDLFSREIFQSEFYHFTGFLSGALYSSVPKKKPKNILRF